MGTEPHCLGFLGIDPGLSGGIAFISGYPPRVSAWKMPETEADIAALFRDLSEITAFGVIEAVHSMPKQGVSSTFKFGRNYGFLRGLLIAYRIPFADVSPQKWQKKLECATHGDKNITKAKAQQLYPYAKVTHATADAILLARYCSLVHWENFPGSFAEL